MHSVDFVPSNFQRERGLSETVNLNFACRNIRIILPTKCGDLTTHTAGKPRCHWIVGVKDSMFDMR